VSLVPRFVQLDVPTDVHDAAVAFWAAALHARAVPDSDLPETYTHLHDAASVVAVHVQRLDDGPARIHLDLGLDPSDEDHDDLDAEVARLIAAGATHVRDDDGFTVLRSPAGLELCLVDDTHAVEPLAPPGAVDSYLDVVFVDVPEADAGTETVFWAAALGAVPHRGDGADAAYTYLLDAGDPDEPLEIAIQRIDGPVRHHLDIVAPDVDVEVARLEALGATRVAAHEDWVVLADPAGLLLCVVPAPDA
jgi:hypothetical protein